MIVTSVVLMVNVYDQTWSVTGIITVEMDLMKLTAVSSYINIELNLHPTLPEISTFVLLMYL